MVSQSDIERIFPEGFSRYSAKSVQQDDLSVRRKLATELEKVRHHVQGIHETGHHAREPVVADWARRVMDEIDVFQSETRLAEMGAKAPLFSSRRGVSPETVARLISFDYDCLEDVAQARQAMEALDAEGTDVSPSEATRTLAKVRSHLTAARNAFRDRRDYLRGIR